MADTLLSRFLNTMLTARWNGWLVQDMELAVTACAKLVELWGQQ